MFVLCIEEENSLHEYFQVEPFLCPWYVPVAYAHSQDEIDRLWNELMNPMELSENNLSLYINRFHYFNATKRFERNGLPLALIRNDQ